MASEALESYNSPSTLILELYPNQDSPTNSGEEALLSYRRGRARGHELLEPRDHRQALEALPRGNPHGPPGPHRERSRRLLLSHLPSAFPAGAPETMSALQEVTLREISLELFEDHRGPSAIDVDDPLVVLEDSGHLMLVDGFKRYFALLAAKRETAWVLVKPWSQVQGRLERLVRNNPRRRTTLREELEVLAALKLEEKLSAASVAPGLGRKTSSAQPRY